jgi:hypothetical protein
MGGPAIVWPGADKLLARAAQRARVPYVLGMAGGATIEEIAEIAPDVCWFQLYRAANNDHAIGFDLLQRAAATAGPTLVLTEGLLVYLTREQVADLAREVAASGARWWLFDLASPMLLKMLARSWQPSLQAANAPMQFAPEEGTAFFAPFGWREVEYRGTWEESRRLNRTVAFAGLLEFLGRFRSRATRAAFKRMSGVVLVERT